MPRRITIKQQRFAKEYIEHGNATKAVIDAGYNVNNEVTAGAIGYENLNKPQIIKMIEGLAPKAVSNIENLANNAKNEGVKLSANKDILDRSGFVPATKNEVFNYRIDIDDKRFSEILRAYKDKNTNRELKELSVVMD